MSPGELRERTPAGAGVDAHALHADARPLAGARILLAEDSLANRRLIGYCLEQAGATVVSVEDGSALVQTLTKTSTAGPQLLDPAPVDLVLTDVEMPEMDGYTATRTLRSLGCRLPIAALTGNTGPEHAERCRAAGCDAHGTKPVDPEALLALCTRLLAGAPPDDAAQPPSPAPKDANRPPQRLASPAPASASELRSDLADDPDMAELLNGFVRDLGDTAQTLESLHRTGRMEELARLAHQLKGSGGSYGFPSITAAAREVEAQARAGTDAGELAGCLAELAALCRAASRTPQR